MATTASAQPPREEVFCHSCEATWYRDLFGLVCPNESCRSDFCEIIERNNDPRGTPELDFDNDDDSEEDHEHGPFHPSLPFRSRHAQFVTANHPDGVTVVRNSSTRTGSGYNVLRTTTTYLNTRPGTELRLPVGDEVIVDLFDTMLQNIMGDHYASRRQPRAAREGGDSDDDQHRRSPHPPGLNPRNADAPQDGDTTQVPDIHTFLASLFAPSEMNNPVIARFLGGPAMGGDYVYSQSELDRIVSQLMEQHQGNAPPPAAKEDIESLPKIHVTQAMVDDNVDCAVCKDDLVLDEEVTRLPCKHCYHFDCVSKWLEAHDTCPICRHPITPEDTRRQQSNRQQGPNSPGNGGGFPFLNLFSAGFGIPPQQPQQQPQANTSPEGRDRHSILEPVRGSSPADEGRHHPYREYRDRSDARGGRNSYRAHRDHERIPYPQHRPPGSFPSDSDEALPRPADQQRDRDRSQGGNGGRDGNGGGSGSGSGSGSGNGNSRSAFANLFRRNT